LELANKHRVDLSLLVNVDDETLLSTILLRFNNHLPSILVASIRFHAIDSLVIRMIVAAYPSVINCSWIRPTPLTAAIKRNALSLVQSMCEAGACLTVDPHETITPLMYAVYFGRQEIVEYLAERSPESEEGRRNALHVAICRKDPVQLVKKRLLRDLRAKKLSHPCVTLFLSSNYYFGRHALM
jgi:ankyrin repeat protein